MSLSNNRQTDIAFILQEYNLFKNKNSKRPNELIQKPFQFRFDLKKIRISIEYNLSAINRNFLRDDNTPHPNVSATSELKEGRLYICI